MSAPAIACDSNGTRRPADAILLVRLHLLLAAVMLVRFLAEPDQQTTAARTLALAFAVYSLAVFLLPLRTLPVSFERGLLYGDIVWLSALIFMSGGGASPLFPFYLFTVIMAAYRFGRADAIGTTVTAAILFAAATLAHAGTPDLPRLAMRSGFLLSLGAMIASLGEANLRQQRRLTLLRDVVSFANPRFGVERTVANIMERCRLHFGADSCLLVARRSHSRNYDLRITGAERPQILPADNPLCCTKQAGVMLFNRPPLAWMGRRSRLMRQGDDGAWRAAPRADGEAMAELCEARSFISVPVSFRGGTVRVTLCAARRNFERADAQFLEQIIAQVLPSIENVYLLDRLASLAALRERRTIGHDLHDSAIQPYIALNTMLAALRRKTGADNPVHAEIDALAAMSAQVIGDLRQFAEGFRRGGARCACALIDAPLRRQLLRAKQWYDVDIRLDLRGAAGMGDRLSAAVLQLAHEGISNICKHTEARHASLCIRCDQAGVQLDIENESAQPARQFVPRSITARATALGGSTAVQHRAGATVVHVEIPA